MSQASEVYTRLLLHKRHGFPLWNPTPDDNLPEEYRERGVSIGDVGIITSDGEFDFLFSICLPRDHQVNCQYGVPVDFEDVSQDVDIEKRRGYHAPGAMIASASSRENSHNSTGAGAEFILTFSTSEGAALLLPDGCSREDTRHSNILATQALRHGLSWYQYANGPRSRRTRNGSLYVVTGCDKTTSWGIASFSNHSGGGDVSLTFSTRQHSYKWETTSLAAVRCGPVSLNQQMPQIQDDSGVVIQQPIRENQCVFIRGFKISMRTLSLRMIMSPVTISSIQESGVPRNSKGRGTIPFGNISREKSSRGIFTSSSLVGREREICLQEPEPEEADIEYVISGLDPSSSKVYSPLIAIKDYFADINPGAQVSITHNYSLCTLSNERRDDLLGFGEQLNRLHDTFRSCDKERSSIPSRVEITVDKEGEEGVPQHTNSINRLRGHLSRLTVFQVVAIARKGTMIPPPTGNVSLLPVFGLDIAIVAMCATRVWTSSYIIRNALGNSLRPPTRDDRDMRCRRPSGPERNVATLDSLGLHNAHQTDTELLLAIGN